MKVSARGREFIADHEGVRTKAYRDSVGVWTIGIGHTASAGPPTPRAGMVISRAEVMEIFARDLGKFEARVTKALGNVPQHVFDGAVSFDFNTGGIHRASWVKHYKAGNMSAAASAFMQWRKPPEIIGRRRDERDLIFSGDYGHAKPVRDTLKPREDIAEGQMLLNALGHNAGKVDGLNGPKTRAATEAFQKRHPPLVVDGLLGPKTLAALKKESGQLSDAPSPPDDPGTESPAAPEPPVKAPWKTALGVVIVLAIAGFAAAKAFNLI